MKKETFIELLATFSHEDINDYIISNGKKPKLINLVTFLNDQEH